MPDAPGQASALQFTAMTQPSPAQLPQPARYFPLSKGRYEVKPGLFRWGQDFGNGAADGQLFQFDRQWPAYRAEKDAARAERLTKYVSVAGMERAALAQVCGFIGERLLQEHPALFGWQGDAGPENLHCHLSGERLEFTAPGQLASPGRAAVTPVYANAWDALGSQLQEDLALIELDETGRSRLCALHLCLPNHWAAEDKIGRSFTAIHDPVAGFDVIARREQALLQAVLERGPFVRYAWGLSTDQRLNHHPSPPEAAEESDWLGRRFNARAPQLYLRVERQVLWGFAPTRTLLFTIRTYHYDCARQLDQQQRQLIAAAVHSMPAASLRYKGLAQDRDAIYAWLCSGTP